MTSEPRLPDPLFTLPSPGRLTGRGERLLFINAFVFTLSVASLNTFVTPNA